MTPEEKERFYIYNALDSMCTLEARDAFWHELDKGFHNAYNMTIRLFEPLMFMQTRGLRVDLSAIEQTKVEIQKSIEEKTEELQRLVGYAINPASPQQVANYFYIEKGVPAYTNSEGSVTTDDNALQRLAKPTAKRQGFKEAKLIQEIRGLSKLKSSYMEVVVDPDQRIRCSWNPRGTKFGRLSSSETVFGTGMNLQNLHPLFKKFIWADPGYFLVEVDKRQAEWVIMAYLSQDAHMLKVVEEGRDPHVFTGSMMFNLPEEIIRLDNKVVGYERDPGTILALRQAHADLSRYAAQLPRNYSGRQVGKHANHGLNYDEGYIRFAIEWELEQSYSKWVVERYHQVYPGIRRYYEWIKEQLRRDRTLVNCFGRQMKFLDQWGNDLFKAAYSAMPQSTQVDGLNIGLCKIYEDDSLCATSGENVDLLAQVHDSIVMQFPLAILDRPHAFHSAMLKTYDHVSPLMKYHGREFTVKTDMKVGLNWGAYNKEGNKEGMQEVELGENADAFVAKVKACVSSPTG